MDEVWKDINGFEGKYQISNKGRVKSLGRYYTREMYGKTVKQSLPEKIMKPGMCNGYYKAQLRKNKKTHYKFVHRLVALHFVPNPGNKPEVNHINSDRMDNRPCNLEWVTSKENCIHGVVHGSSAQKLTKDEVVEIKYLIENAPDLRPSEIGDRYNVSRCTINDIKAERTWAHV